MKRPIKWTSPNAILGALLLAFTFTLFLFIVYNKLGGDQALFLIIGHVAAWAEILVIFLWRKKPPDDGPTPPEDLHR